MALVSFALFTVVVMLAFFMLTLLTLLVLLAFAAAFTPVFAFVFVVILVFVFAFPMRLQFGDLLFEFLRKFVDFFKLLGFAVMFAAFIVFGAGKVRRRERDGECEDVGQFHREMTILFLLAQARLCTQASANSISGKMIRR